MSLTEKLMAGLAIGSAIQGRTASKRFLHSLLIGLFAILALTLISSLLVTAAVFLGLYGLYGILLSYGLSTMLALLAVFGVGLVIVLALMGIVLFVIHELHEPANKNAKVTAASDPNGHILDSFLRGFLGPSGEVRHT